MNRKNIIVSTIGTLVEWAEFTFYGYLVFKFSHLFFSMLTPQLAILAAFAGFAVSYLARPLGGLLFGHFGDKRGRQKALSHSIFLMGIVTLLIGALPTYTEIGFYAPVLLLILRFLQGASVGGEYIGAAVFNCEHDSNNSYLSSSWVNTAAAAGMLIGGLAAVAISLPGMPEWSWRLPFLIGGCVCLIGFYIRSQLSETAAYQNLLDKRMIVSNPIKLVFKHYKTPLIQTMTLGIFVAVYIYVCNIWWITFVIKSGYFPELTARILATFAQASVVILTPLLGFLAQRHQDKGHSVMQAGLIGSILVPLLLFYASVHRSVFGVVAVELFYALNLAAVTATVFKYLSELFPTAIRYTGQAVGWNIGVAIFGGSAPMIAQILSSHHLSLTILYVMLSSIVALWFNRRSNAVLQWSLS
jgi:MHS family proline/betaine transporter-like MFS transporter